MKDSTNKNSFLVSNEKRNVKIMFLILTHSIFFAIGGGFYTFPMYVSILFPEFINLSNQTITLLGSLPFIGVLGVGSVVIFGLNACFKENKRKEFLVLSCIGCFSIALAWGLLILLFNVRSLPIASEIFLLALSLIATGTATACYFSGYLGKALPLINSTWKFVYQALGNACFAGGSILSLTIKLFVEPKSWIIGMFLFQTIVGLIAIVFSYFYIDDILSSEDEETNKEERAIQTTKSQKSTKQLLMDLFLCRTNLNNLPDAHHSLLDKEASSKSSESEPISVTLFYLLLTSASLLLALGTTYLANLGLLVTQEADSNSHDDDDMSNSFKHQVIILIWSSVGQTIARVLLPFVSYWITQRTVNRARLNDSSNLQVVEVTTQKWIVLSFSLLIGITFFLFLILLRVYQDMPFIVASSVISAAYGCVWVVISSYPFFFGPSFNYAVLLSVLQSCGMIGLIVFELIIALAGLEYEGIFTVLIVLSSITIVVVLLTMVEFYRSQ